MSTVFYDGYQIEPSPLVTYKNTPLLAGNQKRLGTTYQITMRGQLLTGFGSPQAGSSTDPGWGGPLNLFWTLGDPIPTENVAWDHRLHDALQKQQALQALFAYDGRFLEWNSPDGSMNMKAQIKNSEIVFDEGIWFFNVPYTIICETDVLMMNGTVYNAIDYPELIQGASETWAFQPADAVKTFSVTHTVSAVGKRQFNDTDGLTQEPWQVARDFCNLRLVLGWNGESEFSQTGDSIFKASSLGSGVINFNGLSPYNFSRIEDVDELGGSYSVTENWLAATGSGTNIYTINANKTSQEPYTTVSASIQGVIHGFYINLFDYDTRIASAEWEWTQLLQGSGLLGLVNAYLPGYNFNVQPVQITTDLDYNAGTLSYAAEFSNRLNEGDVFEAFTVSRKSNIDDYKSAFSINGAIRGRRYDGDTDPTISFTRARAYWDTIYSVSGNLNTPTLFYDRIVSTRYFPEAVTMGLQRVPLNKVIDFNESEGTITYAFDFDNRRNELDIWNNLVEEDYNLNRHFNREEAVTTFSIQGTIKGLNSSDTNPQQTKFNYANDYWNTYVQPNLFARVTGYFNVQLSNNNPQSEEIGTFPIAGTVTYNVAFSTIPVPVLSGVLSEHITVSQENIQGNVNVFAQIPIIGRSAGSLLQSMSTTPVKSRTLTINTIIPATGGPDLGACFATKPNYDSYIPSIAPTNPLITTDSENFDWKMGSYSRSVGWTFE